MKVKVLEAMASGVPVVTTPAGAEGIEPTDGVVVLEEPAALAFAAAELLTDEKARPRAWVVQLVSDFERRYAPMPATEPIVELYRRMARRARRGAAGFDHSKRARRKTRRLELALDVVGEAPTATMIVGVQVDVLAAQIL